MNKLPLMLNNNMPSLRMIENKMPGDSCVGISSKTNKGVNILDNNSKISVRDKILTTRQIPIKIGKAYNINICILPHIFLATNVMVVIVFVVIVLTTVVHSLENHVLPIICYELNHQ